MALVVPKIVYPTGGGSTLTFIYPPRFASSGYQAVRHDNVASSGVIEKIYERRDEFLNFTMEYVKTGSDVAAWDTFVQTALQGTAFDYYPDSTLAAFTTYTLEGTSWDSKYKQLGMFTFNMKFRKRVNWP